MQQHICPMSFPGIIVCFVLISISTALFSQNNVGIGTTSPEGMLHIRNANTNVNSSQLIIEGNSNYGGSTTSAIEFRSNFTSGFAGPSGRIKSYYSSNIYTDAKITFQTIGPGPAFVDAMTLTNGLVGIGTTVPVQKLDVNGNVNISGNIINEAWQTPALLNNWVNYGFSEATAAFYKDKEGRVHLRGSIKGGTQFTIFTLPTGYRPSGNLSFVVNSNFSPGILVVTSGGLVLISNPNSHEITSLDGVSFRAEQ